METGMLRARRRDVWEVTLESASDRGVLASDEDEPKMS